MCFIIFLGLFIGNFARYLCGEIKVSLEKTESIVSRFQIFITVVFKVNQSMP